MEERPDVTARKALDQKYSESNGLPKDEDTKLKKRRTFGREARYIYHQRPRSSRVSYVFRILVMTTRVTPRPHAKPARQTCLASENLPVRDMRKACKLHVRDTNFYKIILKTRLDAGNFINLLGKLPD